MATRNRSSASGRLRVKLECTPTRRYRQYDYGPGNRDYGPPSYYRNPGRHRGHYKRYYRERRYDRYYD